MLVCHCNLITQQEIEQVILQMLKADPWTLIVPAKLYRELGKRGRCCGCFPNVVDIITRVTENYHTAMARNAGELVDVQARLAAMKAQRTGKGVVVEGSTRGDRAA